MAPRTFHRARRALIIGVLGSALAAGGGAAVWAASTPSPSPTHSGTQPSGPSSAAPHHGQADARAFARLGGLHSDVTVKKADGTFVTLVGQRGTVTEATDTKLTVRSEDGYTHSYVLASSTKIRSAADPKTALKASDLKVGDTVAVRAQRSGNDDTAVGVAKGPFPAKAQGKAHHQGAQGQSGRGGSGSSSAHATPSPSA